MATDKEELEEFVKRVERKIDLDELVESKEVYDAVTMYEVLGKVLRRKREPTEKQVNLFLEYYGLVGNYVDTMERRGRKYKIVRDKKGRFVKWLKG